MSMIGFKLLAGGIAAATVMLGASAMASPCTDTCNDKFTACQSGGADGTQCLAKWHQCKDRCQAPSLQKTSTAQTPVPRTKAVAPRPH
jgi:hypothetical protein